MIYYYKRAINPLVLRNSKKKYIRNISRDNCISNTLSKSRDEDFSAPIWRNSILFVSCLVLVYKIDEWYGLHHQGKGGFTRAIEYLVKQEKYKGLDIENLKKISEIAKERLNQQDSKRISIYRLKFPEQFNQGSSYNLKVGAQIDLSQFNIKSDVDSIN